MVCISVDLLFKKKKKKKRERIFKFHSYRAEVIIWFYAFLQTRARFVIGHDRRWVAVGWGGRGLLHQCSSCDDDILFGFSNSSKYFRALRILMSAASEGIFGSDIITMMYVLLVNVLMNAANWLFRTSIDWNLAPNFEQDNLNCFIIFDTFSKRCKSRCCFRWQCDITRNVARSNSSTSSASMMFAKYDNECSSASTFGISI